MSSQPHPRRFILSCVSCILHTLVDTTSLVRLPHASGQQSVHLRVGSRRRKRRRRRARARVTSPRNRCPAATGPKKRAWADWGGGERCRKYADTRCAWLRSQEWSVVALSEYDDENLVLTF
ncbi:hypothetical protein BDN70DRAFT_888326 [Pholiota conissans]|uniref:Uncharacterized protein n=1 Tax=Pholiota conissans TaxID=109636 RepID=A0A9P6CSP6_9AGAR|nr:hypothetical protein BDN70DRAFT_888326 [Pholiota conissans]